MYRPMVDFFAGFLTVLTIFLALAGFNLSSMPGFGSLVGSERTSDMTCDTFFITDSCPSSRRTALSRSINQITSVWGLNRPLHVDPLLDVQCRKGIEVSTVFFERMAIEVSVKTTLIEEFIQNP